MDALTFGSGVLLRHLTFSEARSVKLQVNKLSSNGDITGLVDLRAQNYLNLTFHYCPVHPSFL